MRGSKTSSERRRGWRLRPAILWQPLIVALLVAGPTPATARDTASIVCSRIGMRDSPSPSVAALIGRLSSTANDPNTINMLKRDTVLQGNELSTRADSSDGLLAAQVAKNLLSLDEALSQRRDAALSDFAPDQRIHLRLTLSKLFLNFGCRREAAAALEDAIDLAPGGSILRAQLLTNLGALYTELDQLDEAAPKLREALEIVPKSADYATAKTRLGALSASARLARKRGDRQEALEFYRLSMGALDDPKVKGYFQSGNALAEYERILAVVLINRAILLGYEQKSDEAGPLFERAHEMVVNRPDAITLGLPDLLVAWSDNRLDAGDPDGAIRHLDEAIKLLTTKGGRPELLARALQKRAAIAINRGENPVALDLIRQIEQIPQSRLTPLERANIAATKAALLEQTGQLSDAVRFYEQALADTRRAAPEGTFDVAKALIDLAYAKGKLGDIDNALEGARAADRALSSWLTEESAGCRAGVAPNRLIIAKIRESRGMFAILKRQALRQQGGASEEEFKKIDRDIFDLVQERELDRVGVATERSKLRRTNEETIRRLQQALAELCAARSAFDDAVKSQRPDLTSLADRLNRARSAMAESEKPLQSDVRLKFATGSLKVSMEDLPGILQDREAMIAFRVGSEFSVVFIAVRRGANVVTASVLSRTAKQADIATAVTSVINARKQGDFRGAIDRLGVVLGLAELKDLFEGVDHVFVVPDGDLQRLPAHLLPIGNTPLGDLAPTSTLSSLSMLAALRDPAIRGQQRLRSFAGFGDPQLDDSGCPKPNASDPRQLVNCLGPAYGSRALLEAASAIFGGATAVTGSSATVGALRKADLSNAGILVLATHGLVGGERLSRLPAVVLTPDPSNPADSGLFTTTDIAGMNLDNVWLAIIAACHTAGAAPDSLEEGLSGLGLAFTTAGAKALILSYWDAEPSATEKLLEHALKLIDHDPNLSLSGALAASMKELQKDKYTPEQWAPFVVIGDGTIKIPKR